MPSTPRMAFQSHDFRDEQNETYHLIDCNEMLHGWWSVQAHEFLLATFECESILANV